MPECTPSAPTIASPATRVPSARCSVTLLPSSSKPVQRASSRIAVAPVQRAHGVGEHAVQVGAMDHEIGRAVARDRLGAEIEQLPGLAGIPEPDLLAGRLAPDRADRILEPERKENA